MDQCVITTLVKNDRELQLVRKVRNECRNFMTRNSQFITEEQQSAWYQTLDHEKNWLYIFNKIYHGAIVDCIGYGYNRIENDSILLTGGLIESERGKGYGKILFSFLLQQALPLNIPVKLEVLKTNIPAKKLYKSLGFETVDETDTVIKMEYNNDPIV